ncbi:MAG: hypothetical protein F7B61_06335 [Caldisphaeraceae archaeon]|nr:hypothetical protein [Caldisphaeraceae archaeon]
MQMIDGKTLMAYVLKKTGCIHPFRLSRILAFIEIEWLKGKGERLTEIKYVRGPGTFYIEGLKETIEEDPCFNKIEGDPKIGKRGCIEYRCEPSSLPKEIEGFVNEKIEKALSFEEQKLNEIIVNNELFRRISLPG